MREEKREMENGIVDIGALLNPNYRFEAHEKETIQEHTHKCLKYFERIKEEKKLTEVFGKIAGQLLGEAEKEYRELFEVFLINTIVFHDIGKINPLFQKEKMKNKQFQKHSGNATLGSNHSLISAVLYLQYFLPGVKNLPKEYRKKLRFFLYINAYVIARHHAGLSEFRKFMEGFLQESGSRIFLQKEEVFTDLKCYLQQEMIPMERDEIAYSISNMKNVYETEREGAVTCYTYERLLFSLLVASDYYATSEIQEGFIMESYGTIKDIDKIYDIYSQTMLYQRIRTYQSKRAGKEIEKLTSIYDLRTEMFLETEENLLKNLEENLYYVEAPTGSGKSNTALNLSFQLIKNCQNLNKIMYIYPFNTLVEQNRKILNKIFERSGEVIRQIRVINSITPIWDKQENQDEMKYDKRCQKALLDRQFFNYPIAISTHVTLFDIMFGGKRESAFSFHQLANSVIILDEIQSYRNEIWTEIIVFLKIFAKLLNMKIIIMSATLPNLDLLSREEKAAVRLVKDCRKYYQNPCFKNRISRIDYSLFTVEHEEIMSTMIGYMKKHILENKKILIEFISKKSAEAFYRFALEETDCNCYLLTGDDNSVERARILRSVEQTPEGESVILVATQVIEAGVDINNIDVGFKDISIMDAEEQFMGRVNRSNTGEGIVYFFDYDSTGRIYKNRDARVEKELSLQMPEMQEILVNKKFDEYYKNVLEYIQIRNERLENSISTIDSFWREVGELNQEMIADRMELLEEEGDIIIVYLNRIVIQEDGIELDGAEIWSEYKALLYNKDKYSYARFKVELSEITSKMNYFLYRIRAKGFPYHDMAGELYYIEDGESYFENGKLNRKKFESGIGEFI